MISQVCQFSLPLTAIFAVNTQYMQWLDLPFHFLVQEMAEVSLTAVQTPGGLSLCLCPVLKTASTVMLATTDSKAGLSKNFGANSTGEIVHRFNKFVIKPSVQAATSPFWYTRPSHVTHREPLENWVRDWTSGLVTHASGRGETTSDSFLCCKQKCSYGQTGCHYSDSTLSLRTIYIVMYPVLGEEGRGDREVKVRT